MAVNYQVTASITGVTPDLIRLFGSIPINGVSIKYHEDSGVLVETNDRSFSFGDDGGVATISRDSILKNDHCKNYPGAPQLIIYIPEDTQLLTLEFPDGLREEPQIDVQHGIKLKLAGDFDCYGWR